MNEVDLPPAAAAYRDALPPGGRLTRFPITDLDRLGVPAWSVTFDGPDGSVHGGHGYGAEDGEALVGAMGELSEVVHGAAALARAPRRRASWSSLGAAAVDPRTLCLPAGSPVNPDTELEWVPARRLATGEEVLVPVDVAASLPVDLAAGYRPFTTVITNGLGAGPSLEHALAHGLLELLQRDGNGLAFRALDRGVVLDLDRGVEPATTALLDRVAAAGVEVLPKLATTELGIANVYVVGADAADDGDPLMATACGEAASPDAGRALRKALLEFAAARVRKAFTHGPLEPVRAATPDGYLDAYLASVSPEGEEPRALEAMVEWLALDARAMRSLLADTVLSQRERVAFSSLPSTPVDGAAGLLDDVAGRLSAAGLDVLYVDLSPVGAAELGVHAVKAVVPGLEVETMSYHRIGERGVAKLLELDLGLAGVGAPAPEGAEPVRLTPAAEERLGGPAWLDVAAVDRLVGPLYPLYREPGRHLAPLVAGR